MTATSRPRFVRTLFTSSAFAMLAMNAAPGQATDLIITGNILTMEGAKPTYAEAVAVDKGMISYVGTKAGAMKLKTADTKVQDLGSNVMLPAFLDAHSHYINTLSIANQVKLYPAPAGPGNDVPSIIAEIQKFKDEHNVKPGELIMGYGYDETVMPGGKLLTREDLDKAFPDNPVRIDHISMHGGVLNTAGLKFFKFDPKTPTPDGGIIVRKPGSDEVDGLIMETAFLPIFENTPAMTPQEEIDNTKKAQMMYAEQGVTLAQEGATHLGQLESIERATQADANIIDVVAYPFITDLDKILAKYPRDRWLSYYKGTKIGGVKISIDGSPQGKTAAFTTPYLVPGPGGEKNWKGQLFAPQETINAGLKKVFDLNVPVLFHTNGDAAIDALIKAYEFAAAGNLTKDHDVTSIHAQFLRKDQIPLFVKYHIRPSFFTLHTFYFADAHIKQRGRKQADYISPMRDAIDAGLHPSNHTDAIVVPLDQMFMLWTAVNRVSRSGETIGAGQRVTPYEGLKAMTIWAAEQYKEQGRRGSIAKGKIADFVILDKDPTKVAADAIKDVKVQQTYHLGKAIYTRGE